MVESRVSVCLSKTSEYTIAPLLDRRTLQIKKYHFHQSSSLTRASSSQSPAKLPWSPAETLLHSSHHSQSLGDDFRDPKLYVLPRTPCFPRGNDALVFVLVLKRLYLVLRLKQQRVHGVVTVKSFRAALAAKIASHHDARIYRRLG